MTKKEELLNQIEIERKLQTIMNKDINKAVNKINEEIRQIEAEEKGKDCILKEYEIMYVKTDPETMVADLIEMLLLAGVYSDKAPRTSDRKTWAIYREQVAREMFRLLPIKVCRDEADKKTDES